MKKILFMVATVALMAMVSCNKENTNEGTEVKEPSVVVEFSASISMGAEDTTVKPQSSAATRTTVDHSEPTQPKTLWLKTDKISINGVAFKVKELINGGASAIFVNVDDLPEDFGAPYTAVYPYAAYADGGDGKITKITLPSTQTAKAGYFPEDAVCAAAYSDDAVLKFKNVASVLMFQVDEACETVTISSDDALAGTVNMEPNGDDAVPTFDNGTEKTVTINGPFAVGEKYYVAVLPGTKANFVVRHDGYLSKNAANVKIARSAVVDMKTLPAPVASTWTVKGSFDSWGSGVTLYNDLNGNLLAKNVGLKGAFKLVNSTKYVRSISNAPTIGKWHTLYNAAGDMYVTGNYDIYYSPNNKAMCLVQNNSTVPTYSVGNRELNVCVQSSWGWPYLYGFDTNQNQVWGDWQKQTYDHDLTINSVNYYCWKVPVSWNNKTVTLIASKSGEQANDKTNVKFDRDRFYELKYTTSVNLHDVTAPTF